MVDGQRLNTVRGELVVVDLDGTLVQGNTLHHLARCCSHVLVQQHKWTTLLRLYSVLGLRALRLISHKCMRRSVVNVAANNVTVKTVFIERIDKLMRPSILSDLHRRQAEGANVLLATAAAGTYVSWIWKGPFVASDVAGGFDCRGELKRKAVEQYAADSNMRVATVITDHLDDLPLLSIPGIERLVINPPAALTTALSFANLPASIIRL